MPLTPHQQQRALQHLKKKIPDSTCTACGTGKLEVHPDLTGTPLVELKDGRMNIFVREVIPLVQVVCSNCYRVEHFLAEGVLGSIKKS